MKKYWSAGQSLVELIIVMALLSILVPVLVGSIAMNKDGQAQRGQRTSATGFLREASEAMRQIRATSWNAIATNGTYHPVVNNNSWSLAANAETVNGLTRSIVISDAQRSTTGPNSGSIVTSGGTVDPSTKKITITVSWTQPSAGSINSVYYMTRYLDNLTVGDTSLADFNQGTPSGTAVTNTNGGAVALGAGGGGDWCQPSDSVVAQLDLPKNGVANAISALEGKIYAGTGDNASGVSFANVSVTNTNPPLLNIVGTIDGYKTNDIFAETNYAYIATDTNSKEVVIISMLTSPYTEVGWFNAPGNSSAQAVVTSGTTGYALVGSKLYNFDLTSKTGSRPGIDTDGVSLAGTATGIQIVGNYAYISINNTSTKMQIVDISNPTNLQVVAQVNTPSQGGMAVSVNTTGTRAYLATATSTTQAELFIINTATKSGNLPIISSYDTSGMDPKAVNIVPGNLVLVAGRNGAEYQSVNISNESSPVMCGSLDVPAGINDLASVLEADGDAYSYLLTGTSNNELEVLVGGPGGQYSSDGTYVSRAFDVLFTTAFNYVEAHTTVPNQTTAQYQVAVADAVNNSCANANYIFVGPDGTSNTFFTTEGAIPLDDNGVGYENPGRCFKYKVFLHTDDSTSSPLFEDITINYSP